MRSMKIAFVLCQNFSIWKRSPTHTHTHARTHARTHTLLSIAYVKPVSHTSGNMWLFAVPAPRGQTARGPDLPVTHGTVSRLHDECLMLALPPQLLHVVLELGVLGREDPGLGYEAILLRLEFNHSTCNGKVQKREIEMEGEGKRERERCLHDEVGRNKMIPDGLVVRWSRTGKVISSN